MDVTSKGLGSVVGALIFMPNDHQSILFIVVASTAMLVGTAAVVSSFFRFVARHTYKR